MMHKARIWNLADRPADIDAVELMHSMTWCVCEAFAVGELLWLNDSTGPNGAQEYAVLRARDLVQIESVTVSWCTLPRLREIAARISAEADTLARAGARPAISPGQLQSTAQHVASRPPCCA